MPFRHILGAAVALGLAAGSVSGDQRLTRQEADQFTVKLIRIVQYGKAKPRGKAVPRTTEISDDELNAFFRHSAKDQIPAGIVEPTINAVGDGRVTGRAVVDLDAVRKQKQRGWLDPMGYLTGRLPLTAAGTLTTKDGVGRFNLESAELSGVAVPKTLIQELLSYYSKTPDNPAGINMDAPFELPANIREIRVGRAQATIVQ
ncbi:MAG: hypothetical protein ACRD15_11515 [Vicinamibacterales bacterium]